MLGLAAPRLARVIEYDIPDRDGNGSDELIVLLTTIIDPGGDQGARAGGRDGSELFTAIGS